MIPRFNIQWETDNSSHPRMAQYEHGLYVRTADHLAKIRELESTLAAERASLTAMERNRDEAERERDAFFAALQLSEKRFNAERASRLQADTEQFNAGISTATLAALNSRCSEGHAVCRDCIVVAIECLSKPSVSPEQAERRTSDDN